MAVEFTVPVRVEADILIARKAARSIGLRLGLNETELVLVATAISEIARNILIYAREGEMTFEEQSQGHRRGLVVTARDEGPGIADINKAMQDGFTTGKGLGLGLPGARRLMDDFSIESKPGEGTTIVMKKWGQG